MPVGAVLDLGEAAALDGLGQDHRGPAVGGASGRGEGIVDGSHVVPVDLEHPGAECLRSAGVRAQVPAELGRAALAQAVDVDDRDEVRQLVVRGLVQCLPDRSLGDLAVPAEHPDRECAVLQVLACERDPDAVGQPLAQRSGGDVHPRQNRGGVALQTLSEAPVPGHQFILRDDADGLEHRVQQRRRVPLREDQVVVRGGLRVIPVESQMPGDEHGEQVRSGHARGGMPRAGAGARSDRVDSQLGGDLGRRVETLLGRRSAGHAALRQFSPPSSRSRFVTFRTMVNRSVTNAPDSGKRRNHDAQLVSAGA